MTTASSRRPIAILCLLFTGLSASAAEAVQAHHARVELIVQPSASASNQQAWMGLHFSLEKDWHIYWVNPGDSGLPPMLKWQLPAGFTAGEIQWPRPEKLKRSTLADYGYQDDVVLLVPLHVPAGPTNRSPGEIGLQAKWLICREVCIPDHAELHVFFSAQPDSHVTATFAEARKHLPRPWPTSWKASAVSDKDDFILSIQSGTPISAAEFYPSTPEQIENSAGQPLQTTPQGAKITLKKSDQLLKPIRVLKGLLVLGNGEAYQIQSPVTPATKKTHNN